MIRRPGRPSTWAECVTRQPFLGIVPVLATAVDEDGAVLEQPIRDLIDWAIEQGAHGIAGLGEASDFHKLSVAERLRLTEVVLEQVDGRVPVMIGTTANSLPEAILLTKAASENGADAVFVMPPYVGEPSDQEIVDHFLRLADAVDIDIVLQDNVMPGGGGQIGLSVIADLVNKLPSVRYVKEETPPTGLRISWIVRELGERVGVISGNGGATLLNDLARGAVSCMPGCAPIAGLVRIYESWQRGDLDEAFGVFERVARLIAFSGEHFPPASVEILHRKGLFPTAYVRAPRGPELDDVDRDELTRLLTRAAELA
jgi:dihydrodipicolinate synthase/N-acetylneuraminate lyase